MYRGKSTLHATFLPSCTISSATRSMLNSCAAAIFDLFVSLFESGKYATGWKIPDRLVLINVAACNSIDCFESHLVMIHV